MKNYFLHVILLSLLTASCGPGKSEDAANKHYDEIRGWNILSDNLENAKSVIDAAGDYRINHLQISHRIVHDLNEVKEPEKQDLCNELISYAHEKGIEEVLVWDHALYSLKYYPDRFKTGPDNTIDLDNPEFWEWFREDYRQMLDLIPDVNGIILTFIETGARIENQYSEVMKTPAEKLARVINEVSGVVIGERELSLFARTFIYTREELNNILQCISHIERDEVVLMVKETPHDFFLTHPVQKYIGELGRPLIIEFDAAHEYNGQGIIANTFVETITERWRYYQGYPDVIGYVARTDRYRTTKIIDRPSEILLYALESLNLNPDVTDAEIYESFIRKKYGAEALPYVEPAFRNAFDIVTSSLYTLGLCMCKHSDLTCDYLSTYNRFVSGRWMDNPEFFLEHDVNRKFHYYTDVVNTLAPVHMKEKDSRLFREDPHLRDLGWIQAEELMNPEFLGYIVDEKDYGVSLARESLESIERAKEVIIADRYQDLYDTYYRTLVKARLSRGAAKAYFSYRVWNSSEDLRDQDLLDTFWEGIDEMNEMKTVVLEEFGDSPLGGWKWREDVETVDSYTLKMTLEGWDDYGGMPILNRII